MSKGQTLRVLVNARLTAAAQEIFVLFERTIAEYEEELCRSKQENQRKQELLDSLNPGLNPGLNQGLNLGLNQEPPHIKEKQGLKQEEEQLPLQLPEAFHESSSVCVKTEGSSLLQQRPPEHREETQGEDVTTETHLHSEEEHFSDNDEDWRAHFSCSAAQIETEADGDHYNQVQYQVHLSPEYKCDPETSDAVNEGDVSGTSAERQKHQCSVCQKRFQSKRGLQRHIRVHTGETPYSCSTCTRTFDQKSHLDIHERTHSGEKPFSCLTCRRTFAVKDSLNLHMRTHTGEKPYICSTCGKTFSIKRYLVLHMRTHTGEKPYSCPFCNKGFTQDNHLKKHIRTHTGERPYSCSICNKGFTQNIHLKKHMKTHENRI